MAPRSLQHRRHFLTTAAESLTPTISPRSSPPRSRRRYVRPFDTSWRGGRPLRRRGFWAGQGGTVTTVAIGCVVVALLVGWVLLWMDRPGGGGSIALLVIGSIAFAAVLAILATLHNRLQAHWKLRQIEAAFLSGMSHNLRTPISGIRTAAQVLEQETLAPEQRAKLLSAIVHETRRLAMRVDNVLELGRIEVEGHGLRGVSFDMGELARACSQSVAGLIEGRDGTLTLETDGVFPVEGDDRALRMLIDNLLDNAVNYADGPPFVKLTISSDGEFCLMRVFDRGLGFSEANSETLFRQFWRGDTGRPGTGLGLPLSRAIARGHGGELSIHSDGPGQGAVAETWLPLYRE
jgi:signal transduction histidine kinase